MAHNLAQAAKATGKNRTTILRAIKEGKVSGWRDEASNEWMIEPAELHRVYPPIEASPKAHKRGAQVRTGTSAAERELRARIDAQDALITAHQRTIDELWRRLDKEAEERQRLTLLLTNQATRPAEPVRIEPARRWRFWRRG